MIEPLDTPAVIATVEPETNNPDISLARWTAFQLETGVLNGPVREPDRDGFYPLFEATGYGAVPDTAVFRCKAPEDVIMNWSISPPGSPYAILIEAEGGTVVRVKGSLRISIKPLGDS